MCLISNGGDTDTSAVDAGLGQPAYHVSIYSPEANTFTRGPETRFARLYHSTSILLPDATVLLGGGGLPGPVTNLNAEIYYPGYLFDANGELAERPVITAAPSVLDVRANFSLSVQLPSEVARVVLIKTGAVTHSVDMDQRFVELAFSLQATELQVSLPQNPADTTPGFYHVFVLNQQGVPSVSQIVRINPYAGAFPQPAPPGSVSAMVGAAMPEQSVSVIENEVAAFELMCGADELLIGLHGESDQVLQAAGPVCMRLDRNTGQWTGPERRRPAAGQMMRADSTRGFAQTCSPGQAMIGFRALVTQANEPARATASIELAELICHSAAADVEELPLIESPETSQVCPGLTYARGIRGVQTQGSEHIVGLGLRCEAS